MTYREMRTILAWMLASDGRLAGLDALRDTRGRWGVLLHDRALERTVPLADFGVFVANAPLFVARPQPQPLHFWAPPSANLHLAHVLGILRHIEQAYPRWMTQAILGNERVRYEMMLLDQTRVAGVFPIRSVQEFDAVFRRGQSSA